MLYASTRAQTCGLLHSLGYNNEREAYITTFSEMCGLLPIREEEFGIVRRVPHLVRMYSELMTCRGKETCLHYILPWKNLLAAVILLKT
jgi:hypothetical protein